MGDAKPSVLSAMPRSMHKTTAHAKIPVAIQKFCQEKQNRREGRLGEDDKEKPPLNHFENLRIDTYLVYQIMHKNSVKSYEKNLGAFISF